jgi:endonuclease/exonuclease/phosphatase family metal-dependent hydrolase
MALVSYISCFEKHLVVYNVHLESRGNEELRCRQLIEILGDVRQYPAEVPVVIAGDLNLDLSRELIASIIRVFVFTNAFKSGRIRTTTTMRSPLKHARAVDWILVGGSLNCTETELHDSVRASDHYPLSITLLSE